MFRLSISVVLVALLALSGCAITTAKNSAEKRQAIISMKEDALTELFQKKPDLRKQINAASGYAVFSNANVNLVLASFGGGYGLVTNNATGKTTYMKMGEVGVGLGLGVKDFRIIFVFHSTKALNRFIEQGWAVGAQADAAAKVGEKGAAVGGEAIVDDVSVYQLTEAGLALQATIKGTKFWKDEALN